MDTLTSRFPLHISEDIISYLEFEGNYTRGELEMWAELNSYPYLKRRIAKKISIVLFKGYLKQGSTEVWTEHYLEDKTMELLSRCTDSFFILTRNMDQNAFWILFHGITGLDFFVVDVFNYFGQRPREHHRCLEVLNSLEFMRLMKQTQYKPESMYVITQFPRQKYAMESLFLPPRLLPKAPFLHLERTDSSGVWMSTSPLSNLSGYYTQPLSRELGGFAENLDVRGFTNPPWEFRGFAENIYLKEGYLCKIENFWMRLLMVLKIKVDSKYEQKCFEETWLSEIS